jgi:hypothetical protein
MSNLIERFILGTGITPPSQFEEALKLNFENAANVEWFRLGEGYEAIFYQDNLEHLACFDSDSLLINYKVNLPEEFLPVFIKETVEGKGEIMNVVLINQGNHIVYEVIIRSSPTDRFLLILSHLGKIEGEKKL